MQRVPNRAASALLLAPLAFGVLAVACSGTFRHAATSTTTAATAKNAPARALPDVRVSAASFPPLRHMTHIRDFYVTNLLGNPAATVAVARAPGSRPYPPGTLLQLVPQEAMVK